MSLRNIWAITLKELRHIWRDLGTLFLFTLLPTVLLFMMAYMVTADIEHVPIAVLDFNHSPTSRAFIMNITVGEDLDLYAQVDSMDEIETMLLEGSIKAAVVIDPNFETELFAMRSVPLQILVDGTEPQSGGYAVNHISSRAEEFLSDLLANQMFARGIQIETLNPVDLRVRTWYNPSLKPSVDLIPGLISMVLGVPSMSVALAIAREREHGTLEQLMATPIGRGELLLGKMLPYILSGILNVVLMTLIAKLWFKVPFNGNFLVFLLLSCAYMFATLSLSMVLGVFIRTQAAALALTLIVVFFPGFFLTGIFFPLASMPEIVRLEGLALPGTHYAIITRGSFINGIGLDVLWPNGLALFAMGVLFTGVAAMFFRKKLG